MGTTSAAKQVNFRLPADLRAKLQAAADSAGRTLTAEIVLRLERSIERERSTMNVDGLISQLETTRKAMTIVREFRDKPTSLAAPGHEKMLESLRKREALLEGQIIRAVMKGVDWLAQDGTEAPGALRQTSSDDK